MAIEGYQHIDLMCWGFCKTKVPTTFEEDALPEMVDVFGFYSWDEAKKAGWTMNPDIGYDNPVPVCPDCSKIYEAQGQNKVASLIKFVMGAWDRHDHESYFSGIRELERMGYIGNALDELFKDAKEKWRLSKINKKP